MGKTELAEKLRAARKAAGFTQARAAEALDMNMQTISDYERGRTRVPAETLKRLCALYNLTPGELLGTDGEQDELNELREALRVSPGMRMLFSISKNATEEDIRKAVAIIEALKKESEGEP